MARAATRKLAAITGHPKYESGARSARGREKPSGLTTPSRGGSFITGWKIEVVIAARLLRMTSQNTGRQRRLRRLPSGNSRNSMAGAAKRTGMKIQFDSQAITSPPGRDPGLVESVYTAYLSTKSDTPAAIPAPAMIQPTGFPGRR